MTRELPIALPCNRPIPSGVLFAMRAVCVVVVLFAARPSDAGTFDWRWPDRSYIYDGGAVPLLYLPIVMLVAVRASDPPEEPVLFSAREGGATYNGGQYPVAGLYIQAGVIAGTILAAGDDSRWFHLKGFAQGLATTQLLTALAKNTFGRHRPHFDPSDERIDTRRSFWSGHSSSTLATATYLALYARQHIFPRWRGDRTLPWWELASYAGLATAALAIPYSQYRLNRHHASDVLTGSLVGAGVSAAAYWFQERRYRRSGERREEPRFTITPHPELRGIAITGSW